MPLRISGTACVPEMGLEPTQGNPHTPLKRACLPISPLRHLVLVRKHSYYFGSTARPGTNLVEMLGAFGYEQLAFPSRDNSISTN